MFKTIATSTLITCFALFSAASANERSVDSKTEIGQLEQETDGLNTGTARSNTPDQQIAADRDDDGDDRRGESHHDDDDNLGHSKSDRDRDDKRHS